MSATVYEEDMMNDLKTYLSTNLNTYLTAITTLKGDGIAIPDVKKYEIGTKDIFALNQNPAGLLYPGEIEYDNEFSLGCTLLKLPVFLTIALSGGKAENLVAKAMRYAAAIRQCIDADRTAGGTLDRMATVSINFYASAPGQENKMVIDSVIDTEKSYVR